MNIETQIFLALNLDKSAAVRRIAATVAYRYWMEMHRNGWFRANEVSLQRIVRRFNLGDWVLALSAHYPVKAF